jgi:hypothetical protein
MAKAKKSVKKPAKRPARKAAPKTPQTVKSVLSKSALVAHLAGTTGAAAKDVRAVLAALEGTIHFTGEEMIFKAKPATVKVKVRPMKKLKDAASA